jgi:hypothetical protein
MAAAIFSGGSLSRVAELNAQANSACRRTVPSGALGPLLVSAMVEVIKASATDQRETRACVKRQEHVHEISQLKCPVVSKTAGRHGH